MCECIEYNTARSIMGTNFIGIEELRSMKELLVAIPETVPTIQFSEEELLKKKDDYILILGVQRLMNGNSLTIRSLKEIFGMDPEQFEPCFYNQDWYEKESFIDTGLSPEWFLIRKNVFEDSRAVSPEDLMKKYYFPSAITCVYAFFVTWFIRGEKLWCHDFIWCKDVDHNGDRIYIGRYYDTDGVNKNGFNIHRHLALRSCYACID